jgi:predicted nucleic acid-binding protein
LLEVLFGEVIVPPAVMHEFMRRGEPPAWLVERAPADNPDREIGTSALGRGEREAVMLALQVGADSLILDDEAGRRLALSLGLPIIGTLGLLLVAKQQGAIAAIHPIADALVSVNFRLSPRLVEGVLVEDGEAQGES